MSWAFPPSASSHAGECCGVSTEIPVLDRVHQENAKQRRAAQGVNDVDPRAGFQSCRFIFYGHRLERRWDYPGATLISSMGLSHERLRTA